MTTADAEVKCTGPAPLEAGWYPKILNIDWVWRIFAGPKYSSRGIPRHIQFRRTLARRFGIDVCRRIGHTYFMVGFTPSNAFGGSLVMTRQCACCEHKIMI